MSVQKIVVELLTDAVQRDENANLVYLTGADPDANGKGPLP